MISDMLCLDTDPDLFLEKTIDDTGFIDGVLSALMKCLIDNQMLVDREEELDKLADLEWRFEQVLTGIRGDSGLIDALNHAQNREKLLGFKNNCIQRRKTIEGTRSYGPQPDSESVVTISEMNQLLQGF